MLTAFAWLGSAGVGYAVPVTLGTPARVHSGLGRGRGANAFSATEPFFARAFAALESRLQPAKPGLQRRPTRPGDAAPSAGAVRPRPWSRKTTPRSARQ